MTASSPPIDAEQRFHQAFARFDPTRPVQVFTHNDADGLSAGALFARGFQRLGREFRMRVFGRGENPWSSETRDEFANSDFGGLIVADLGCRAGAVLTGVPTIIVDHHVPTGHGAEAAVITGYGMDPIPSASLLAFQCVRALGTKDDLLWLAAVGLLGDYGDKAPFAELADAKKRYTASALRELTSLVNAPRRSATGDAAPALDLLLKAESPKDALSGRYPESARLQAARDEVKAAVEVAKRVPPRVSGDVALISLDSPCQVHPLVAQAWRMRLKDKIVIAANRGFRPGWVHFACRSATGRNLINFLREVAPPNADENYGNGHEQATGGALRDEDWPLFLRGIGFDADGRRAVTVPNTKAAA